MRSARQVQAYYPKVAAAPRTTTLKFSPLVGAGTVSPMVLGLYLSFVPYFCVYRQLLLCVGECCCALCPFGLTYQRFGMVWDAKDLVGWNKLHFLVYYCLLFLFCNLFIGEFGVSHYGPILGVLHHSAGAQHQPSVPSKCWNQLRLTTLMSPHISQYQILKLPKLMTMQCIWNLKKRGS